MNPVRNLIPDLCSLGTLIYVCWYAPSNSGLTIFLGIVHNVAQGGYYMGSMFCPGHFSRGGVES